MKGLSSELQSDVEIKSASLHHADSSRLSPQVSRTDGCYVSPRHFLRECFALFPLSFGKAVWISNSLMALCCRVAHLRGVLGDDARYRSGGRRHRPHLDLLEDELE